jgi:hypothetical protein
MSRSLKINLDHDGDTETGADLPLWLERFADELGKQKTAVEVAREREDSIADQMHQILHGKRSRYSSVEEAVADYQKRTGLLAFQKKMEDVKMKAFAAEIAADDDKKKDEIPKLIKDHPQIDAYIRNFIATNPSESLPAIVFGILETFGRSGINEQDIDYEVNKYINSILAGARRPIEQVNMNIGKGVGLRQDSNMARDPNRDAWVGLIPAPRYY